MDRDDINIQYGFLDQSSSRYVVKRTDQVGNSKLSGWKSLSSRRSFTLGGTISKSGTLLPINFPSFLDLEFPRLLPKITQTVRDLQHKKAVSGSTFTANHILVNEYVSKSGILPHTDGAVYKNITVTLSLSSHTILILTPPPDSTLEPLSIFLPPRSLLILSGELYDNWLHSIEPLEFDTMDSLKACINWDDWWSKGAEGLEDEVEVLEEDSDKVLEGIQEEGEEESIVSSTKRTSGRGQKELDLLAAGVIDLEISKTSPITSSILGLDSESTKIDHAVKLFVAKRRMVEFGGGWERKRRISLTCREVKKVYKGLKLK